MNSDRLARHLALKEARELAEQNRLLRRNNELLEATIRALGSEPPAEPQTPHVVTDLTEP